jgi:hypothetical protein
VFSNASIKVERTVVIEMEVTDVPRFERTEPPRSFRECGELIPARLFVTYVNDAPTELSIRCNTVRADGSPGSYMVDLKWRISSIIKYPVATLSQRPIPGWAIGFLEQRVGIEIACSAGATRTEEL